MTTLITKQQQEDDLDNVMKRIAVAYEMEIKEKIYIWLPIDKIDDIDVDIGLAFYKNQLIILEIKCKNIMYDSNEFENICLFRKVINSVEKPDEDRKADRYEIMTALKKLQILLPKLKFSKYHGEFRESEFKLSHDYMKFYGSIDNIQLEMSECCVCSEITIQRTRCKHNLCICCWDRLPQPYKCPLCRKYIEYMNEDED